MTDRSVPQPTLFRLLLVAIGGVQVVNGLYALFAPRSFYDDFPAGRGWVAALPSYSEHLVRDIGGLFLATGVLLLIAAVWLERRLVIAALVTWLLFAVPHTVYHLFNLEPFSTGDAIANVLTLATTVAIPIGLLVLLARTHTVRRPTAAGAPNGDARIALVERPSNLLVRYAFRTSRRRVGTVMEPLKAFGHHPTLLAGYASLELAAERSHRTDERLKELAVMRAAMLTGCEWCLDFGSALMLAGGISEDELRDLPRYRDSDRFSELDKLVLDYATAISRTPVEVSDDLVARLREHLDEAQIVELTTVVALENLRARFNWALGIGSQRFTDGAYCVMPEPAVAAAQTV
jgi:4-carboxymuconolactone decarboxylase